VHVVVQDVVTLDELAAVGEVVADAAGPQP
jgi:hypothetical protein